MKQQRTREGDGEGCNKKNREVSRERKRDIKKQRKKKKETVVPSVYPPCRKTSSKAFNFRVARV